MGWHDVATRLRGPAVTDVAAHFAPRWGEVTGETLEAPPPPHAAGSHQLQVVRTVPEKVYAFLPHGTTLPRSPHPVVTIHCNTPYNSFSLT
jgi:phosphatidylserine/phosphatidylglycerophosphate/cardiolipin synthase-like enzyme